MVEVLEHIEVQKVLTVVYGRTMTVDVGSLLLISASRIIILIVLAVAALLTILFVVHLIQIGVESYHVLLWGSLLIMLNLLFGLV